MYFILKGVSLLSKNDHNTLVPYVSIPCAFYSKCPVDGHIIFSICVLKGLCLLINSKLVMTKPYMLFQESQELCPTQANDTKPKMKLKLNLLLSKRLNMNMTCRL